MNRFSLIVVHFGQFNDYFDLWLESCARNKEIDWLIMTDDMRFVNIAPSNVKFFEETLKGFIAKVEQSVGVCPSIKKPYKLCDFRPAFGHIFSNFIEGYDYWGHCDTDLIFGDILGTLTISAEDIFNYDRIYIRGHLSFYKNIERINTLYRTKVYGLDYVEILSDEKHHAFDEWYGIWAICKHQKIRMLRNDPAADLDPKYTGLRLRYNGNYNYQVFGWVDGKVLRYFCRGKGKPVEVEEFNRIHFLKHPKLNPYGIRPGEPFLISYDKFIPFSEPLSSEEIRELNFIPFRDRLRGLVKSFFYSIKNHAWVIKWHFSRRAFFNIWN